MDKSIDLDWLTIIVSKKTESHILGEGYFTGSVFVLKMQNAMGVFYNRNTWKQNLHQYKTSTILETSNHYQINFTGEFFLDEKYKEKIKNLLTMLKAENFEHHFTRIDLAYTVKESFDTFYKKIKRTKFNDLTKVEFSKNGKTNYLSAYSSRYAFVGYDKTDQMRVRMKGNKDYKEQFNQKYKNKPGDEFSRLEIRLKGKDTCSVLSHSKDFFNELKSQFYLQIDKRVKISKKLKKELKNSPFNF